ncbi:MAG: S8 family peptidase, partial [Lachnospiraceae bacterium]|nr:S8 family peptidase [Lachnospiraceae bacterium]
SLSAATVNAQVPANSPFAGQAAPPEGFSTGVEFDKVRIDAALAAPTTAETMQLVPSRDTTGHGTAVTSVAAATGVLEGGRYAGMAPAADLLIVKLGFPSPDSFPRTTELMRALTYTVNKAVGLGMPVAINLSFGNTYGPHDGSSILERFIDNITEIGRNIICVGTGNEGAAGGHLAGRFGQIAAKNEMLTRKIELNIAPYQQTMNVQLWKEFSDQYQIELITPNGEREWIDTVVPGKKSVVVGETKVLIFIGEPSPYTINQEIYFDFIPQGSYVSEGIWTFAITPVYTINGNYDFYLPSSGVLNAGTGFFTPTPEKSLTIPSTASKVITVGAYDVVYESYADFSGRGYVLQSILDPQVSGGSLKPDLAAPGVNVQVILPGNQPGAVNGTSFATPFVTGAAALLMEWGIVKERDVYLYGEKIKAYLRKGARTIRGEREYPNARVGYGALCVEASIPK